MHDNIKTPWRMRYNFHYGFSILNSSIAIGAFFAGLAWWVSSIFVLFAALRLSIGNSYLNNKILKGLDSF